MVTGYKQTELGIIPNDWNVELLGNIASPKARIGWQNLRKDEFLDSGDFMLITGTDFENGKINYKICKYVSKERYLQDENIQVKNGDILITKDGTLGKVAFVQELHMPATLNAGVFVLTGLSNEVNNRFLYQYLCTEKLMKYAEKTSTGGTIQHLNQGVLVNFPIPIPPLKEQKRIAQSLFDMDTLIAKSEQAIKKYRALKQTCLQHMFPRAGQTEPDIRLPGFTGPWEQHKLSDLVEKICVGFVGTCEKYYTDVADGIPMYRTGDLSGFALNHTGIKYVTREFHKKNKKSQLKYGDILIARHGDSGKAIVYDRNEEANCLNIVIIRPNSARCNGKFLAQRINTFSVSHKIKKMAAGSTQIVINTTDIEKLILQIPKSLNEQAKIISYFISIDNLITLHQRTCEKYKKIKQGMMEELLSGKIRLV